MRNPTGIKRISRCLQTFTALLILCLCVSFYGSAQANTNETDSYGYTVNNITATDALGRKLSSVSGYKEDKYVGLFYFLWHGQHNADKVRNITELLKTNYDDLFDTSKNNKIIPYYSWLHYQEPLYGYYNSMDEWVMRKHIEMFISMNIDFLVMDFTNGVIYWDPLYLLMDLLLEYQAAGWDVPKITFYVNLAPLNLTKQLYKKVYKNDRYKDLVFYGNSEKPIIISVPHLLNDNLNNYFNVRASQWYRDQYPTEVWPYWDITREWKKYTDMVSVSLAQSGSAFSFMFEGPKGKKNDSWGRGYTSSKPVNGDVDAILRGDNFQEGWDEAIKLDPEYIFITGWNEWVVQKMNLKDSYPDSFSYDFPNYTDNFNVEFSRDIEMTKNPTYVLDKNGEYTEEGYGDNYLLQLFNNIRRFKGIEKKTENYKPVNPNSINIDGDDSQWDRVNETYIAVSTQKTARDYKGFYTRLSNYTQAAPDNFIKEVKIAYDDSNVYFRITTDKNISSHKEGKTNWMNLFIGLQGSDKPAWETFNYVINRNPVSDTKTSVESFKKNGSYTFNSEGEVDYRINGNKMQISISRKLLGVPQGAFKLTFKVTDSIDQESNILDYYISGESFPLGRMAYTYEPAGRVNEVNPVNSVPTSGMTVVYAVIAAAVLLGGVVLGIFLIKKKKNKT